MKGTHSILLVLFHLFLFFSTSGNSVPKSWFPGHTKPCTLQDLCSTVIVCVCKWKLLLTPDIKLSKTREQRPASTWPDSKFFPVCIWSWEMYPLVASLRTNTLITHLVGLFFMHCLHRMSSSCSQYISIRDNCNIPVIIKIFHLLYKYIWYPQAFLMVSTTGCPCLTLKPTDL